MKSFAFFTIAGCTLSCAFGNHIPLLSSEINPVRRANEIIERDELTQRERDELIDRDELIEMERERARARAELTQRARAELTQRERAEIAAQLIQAANQRRLQEMRRITEEILQMKEKIRQIKEKMRQDEERNNENARLLNNTISDFLEHQRLRGKIF